MGINTKKIKVGNIFIGGSNDVIIQSMTKKERRNPDIIKATRKQRIAAGSGTTVQEVNKLLSQFETMKKMMSQFKSGKMKLPF